MYVVVVVVVKGLGLGKKGQKGQKGKKGKRRKKGRKRKRKGKWKDECFENWKEYWGARSSI